MHRILTTLIVWALFPYVLAAYSWPDIQPVEKNFEIRSSADAYVYFDVTGKDGKMLYHFECSTPNIAVQRKIQFDYTGDFSCRLWSPADPRHQTLLVENLDDNDWMSRARFFAYELVDVCREYPEFGRLRHFRLRGMFLTLALDDVHLEPKESTQEHKTRLALTSFRLNVSIRPDSTAKSTIAEQPNVREPLTPDVPDEADAAVLAKACKQVRPRRIPGHATSKLLSSLGLDPPYPEIVPVNASLQVGLNSPGSLAIRNKSGEPVYKFTCDGLPNGFQSGLSALVCSLRRAEGKYDLLGEAIDPYSLQERSKISLDQAVGACRDYPDWGSVRAFDLRGFHLVVTVEKLVPSTLHEGEYTKADIKVSVSPKPDASAPIALPSLYSDPALLPLTRQDACIPTKVDP